MSEPLSEKEIAAVATFPVWDEAGEEVKFGSLFEHQKTIVVFIRHFFCGICQDYVTQLAGVRNEALTAAGVKLVVIGCGDSSLISKYKEITKYSYDLYADPTRNLHRELGFASNLNLTPEGEPKKSYVGGFVSNLARSIWRAALQPTAAGKQGNISQLGGDFILGPGIQCTYAWRMRHTQDHVEVKDLMAAASVEFP